MLDVMSIKLQNVCQKMARRFQELFLRVQLQYVVLELLVKLVI